MRVVPHGHKPFPNYPLWNVVANRLSRIGIQTGTFYCPRHNSWCLRQGWKIVPAMILAMPSKDDRGPKIEVYQVSSWSCEVFRYIVNNHLLNASSDIYTLLHSHLDTTHIRLIEMLSVTILSAYLTLTTVSTLQNISPVLFSVRYYCMFGSKPSFHIKIFLFLQGPFSLFAATLLELNVPKCNYPMSFDNLV